MVSIKTIRILIISQVLMFIFTVYAYSADWPRWRGPNGDGISTETDWDPIALSKGPKIIWKTKIGISLSNVSIKGKYLYTIGSDFKKDIILCLDSETGKEIWRYTYECGTREYGPQATPTIDGEFVYTLSTEGLLYCLDTLSGKVQWYKHLVNEYNVVRPFYGFAGSPVVEDDLLIISGNSHGIAINKKTGNIVWKSLPCEDNSGSNTTGSLYASPVVYTHNNKRYAAVYSGYGLYSVDVETGNPNRLYEKSHAYHSADPIIFDNKMFISTGYGVGCTLLDISSDRPKVLWQNKNMSNHFNTCVLIDGYLYGCHGQAGFGEGVLRCLDVKSGKVMWEKDLRRPVCLSAANNMLLILKDMGVLYIAEASPESYKEISSAKVLESKCWTPPVLCNGKIYCKDNAGNLVCLDMRK